MFAFLFTVAHVEDEAGTTRTLVVIAANFADAEEAADGLYSADHNITPMYNRRGFQAIGELPTGTPWPGDSTE